MIRRLIVLVLVGFLSGCSALNQPPVAQLTVDVDQGAVPLTVELDGSSSFDPDGRVVGWRWDFGDGSSGQGKIVSHTYTQSGAYTITLTVSDNLGATSSQQLQISAGKLALVAAFFATPGSGWAPLQVQFDAGESQAPRGATYEWDFGDGGQGSEVQASHRYEAPGSYRVTLDVRHAQGPSDRAEVQVRVLDMALLDTVATVVAPTALAAGDFDGDGVLDVVVSSARQASVALMKGQAGGRFAAPRAFAVGQNPRNLISEDFDRDGVMDLASANFDAGTVSVLLGQRNGGLRQIAEVTVGAWPFDLAAADFDNDGLADVAVSNAGDSSLTVLFNGQQTFETSLVLETGRWPSAVLAQDFNRDGNADLAIANFFSDSISIYLGNGDGTFGSRHDVAVGVEPVALAAGDLDDDGILDLAVANAGEDTVSLLRNLGSGRFALEATHPAGRRPWGVALRDLDGDGRLDLVVSSTGSGGMSAWLASGAFAFDRRRGIGIGDEPLDMVAADLDDDGNLEWLILDFSASQLILLEIE